MTLINRIKTLPQYLVPQHGFSRLVSFLTHKYLTTSYPRLKNRAIKKFIRRYGVDMSEAVQTDYTQYDCFKSFFIRQLRPELRPIDSSLKSIVSPVDGVISQLGKLDHNFLIQAKGHRYRLTQLLGCDMDLANEFMNGHWMTLYLAPKHYHRVHMPMDGHLVRMIYVPGELFSVNNRTSETVPGLLARNERVICLFDTAVGQMAVIFVGAIIVSGIHISGVGDICPQRPRECRQWQFPNPKTKRIHYKKGDELGYFKLGSTVIVLFQPDAIQWDADLASAHNVQFGQAIGEMSQGVTPNPSTLE